MRNSLRAAKHFTAGTQQWTLHEFRFEWDDVKAVANVRKHGVSFDLARTIFNDPLLLTIADLEHSETEERWFSMVQCFRRFIFGWKTELSTMKVRIVSARKSTQTEIRQYEER